MSTKPDSANRPVDLDAS